MKLKNWLTAAALTILPKYGHATEQSAENDSIPSNNIETLAPELSDSITIDTLSVDSLATDSVLSPEALYETRLNLLREAREDMLLLIAHFENIKANAYWDKAAKCYSVGLGFTHTIDGKKVNKITRIKSKEELMNYWIRYTEDKMFPTMAEHLAIEHTDIQERVALGCTAFNTGDKIYGKKEPSAYAQNLNHYFETRDSIYLNKALYTLNKYVKSRGRVLTGLVKRRRVESDILAHKIVLVKADTLADSLAMPENAIDLSKTIIGATSSIGDLPESSIELATKIREYDESGYNYIDTLNRAFSVPPVATSPVKRRGKAVPQSGVKKTRFRGGR